MSRAQSVGPVGQVVGEPEYLACVSDDGRCTRSDGSPATVPVEQRHTDAAFQFGQALRQGRRTDTDAGGSHRPGRLFGHCDEVLELSDRQVGKRLHLVHNTSDLLHNSCLN